MIRPSSRLIYAFALVALPLAILAAASPAAALPLAAMLCGLLFVAALDAVRGRHRLDDVTLQAPGLIRLQKQEPGSIPLEFRHTGKVSAPVTVVINLPRALGAEKDQTTICLPAMEGISRLELACTPQHRGSYQIEMGALEIASPWGFWRMGRRYPLEAEVRVYPSLLKDRKATALFLSRGAFGVRLRRQTGKGREFDKVRDYQPGDPLQDIHWKATAKRRTPMSKTYQIERTQEVVVVLDASRLSMLRDQEGSSLMERFITSALVLGLAAKQQGDHFGIVAFNDKVRRFVAPRGGGDHFQVCRDLLYSLEATPVSPDFHELATTLRLRLRKRALIIFLTSLNDPATAEAFQAAIPPLCRQHLLMVNMVRPPHAAPLFSGEAPEAVGGLYQHLAGHLQWRELRELRKALEREGVKLSLFDEEKLSVELVSQYMDLKSRQVL